MTTKEIAESVNKSERSVQRWAKTTGDKVTSIGDKVTSVGKTGISADYTIDETIAIIETGMGKNAADLYRMSARNPLQNEALVSRSDIAAIIAPIVAETIKQLIPYLQGTAVQSVKAQSVAADVPALPPIDPRKELNMLAREAGYAMGDYREPYNQIYKHAYYRLGVNLRERAKNRGIDVLDYATESGYMPQLIAIAREIFK